MLLRRLMHRQRCYSSRATTGAVSDRCQVVRLTTQESFVLTLSTPASLNPSSAIALRHISNHTRGLATVCFLNRQASKANMVVRASTAPAQTSVCSKDVDRCLSDRDLETTWCLQCTNGITSVNIRHISSSASGYLVNDQFSHLP